MYTIKNKTYADIGHVLKHKNVISFNFENVCENDVEEIKIDIDNIHIERNFIVYSKELQDYKSYSEYKD
jgi:hypothetical protein